jgi:hypothetical protein
LELIAASILRIVHNIRGLRRILGLALKAPDIIKTDGFDRFTHLAPSWSLDLLSSSSEFRENLNEGAGYAAEFPGYFLYAGRQKERQVDGIGEVLIVIRAGIAYKLRLNFEDFVLLKHPPVRL